MLINDKYNIINTNIYKVGRTKDILRRYTEYPKG